MILYIATSLDGYIAKTDGSVKWLSIVEKKSEDYGYAAFYQTIDALVMGSKTYEQILGFGDWPYKEKPSYVLTRREIFTEQKNVEITTENPKQLIKKLQDQKLDKIWLVGGGALIKSFIKEGLIDEYIISIIPIILGQGIRLFQQPLVETNLKCIETRKYSSGLVQVTYQTQSAV